MLYLLNIMFVQKVLLQKGISEPAYEFTRIHGKLNGKLQRGGGGGGGKGSGPPPENPQNIELLAILIRIP